MLDSNFSGCVLTSHSRKYKPVVRRLPGHCITRCMVLIMVLSGCGKSGDNSAAAKAQQPPPPEVAVVTVHRGAIPLTRELVGRLAASRTAQVRARVAGIIVERAYTEGTDVKRGDLLYRIDPAPLEATLHAQEAALAKAQADAANASSTAKRFSELHTKKLISQQDLDNALANERTTAAAVKQAQANLESARLDLDYATVTAPINGRAGRAMVDVGELVGQDEATVLTTIEKIDPIYLNFSLSVAQFEQLQQLVEENTKSIDESKKITVDVQLQDGSKYPEEGTLDFTDMAVDPGTGAVSLRAVIPNPGRRLLPGMFVKLTATLGQVDNAYMIPQAAVARDNTGAYVLTVDDGTVQQRRIELKSMTVSDWIVMGDLKDGDQVIVAGLQKVRPGAPATAVPAAGEQITPEDGTASATQ
jgi:membrane fusion protein, multidrug efflux system